MGLGGFFRKKENLLFILFILLYLIFVNYQINSELGYDESRHTAQGHFFYDYFRTILSSGYLPMQEFLQAYMEKGYNIGWLVLYDPPFHAIVQAMVFMFGGVSAFTARFATEILSIIGAFLLFALSKKVLKNKFQAFAVVALWYMSGFGIEYSRQSFLPMAIQSMMIGWFYYTFYKKGKVFNLRFSNFVLRFKTNILIGGLFLTAATLMKYQSLIFASAFMAVYILYRLYRHIREEGSWKDGETLELTLDYGMQCAAVFVIGVGWMRLSLWDYQMYGKVIWAGVTIDRVYSVKFFTFFFTETLRIFWYVSIFALVPMIGWIRNRKDSWLSRHMDIFLYVIVIYIVATFLISNKQIRYMVHALPLFSIIMVKGIADVSEFVSRKVRFKHVFAVVIVVILFLYAYLGVGVMQKITLRNGIENYELIDFLREKPDPKYVINVKASGNLSAYYFNPDLFVHNTMRARKNNEPDPRKFQQWSQTLYWSGVKQDVGKFIQDMAELSKQVDTYIVLFKFDAPHDIMVEPLGAALESDNFTMTETSYYKIYQKGPTS